MTDEQFKKETLEKLDTVNSYFGCLLIILFPAFLLGIFLFVFLMASLPALSNLLDIAKKLSTSP